MLVYDSFEPFIFMTKTMVPDGEGGMETTYVDGAEFLAGISNPNSSLSKIADALTERRNVQITTNKSVALEALDVVKRVRDKKTYRILPGGEEDNQTPPVSTLDLRSHQAEEWSIPLYRSGKA